MTDYTDIAALPPAKQEHVADSNARGVGVKPLGWPTEPRHNGIYRTKHNGTGIYYMMRVHAQNRVSWRCSELFGWNDAESEEAAKAAAQADYEARILAALSPTDAAQPTTEKGGDAFENRNPDRPNPATSPGVTAGADAAQEPFRIEDMTLADLMRDPLYEAATTPTTAQVREAALREAVNVCKVFQANARTNDAWLHACEIEEAILAMIGEAP